MTEKRLRKGPPGTARRPRCEDMYPSLDNPSRTRFRTSDNVLFDVADTAVTPSRVMTRVISDARRAAAKPLRVEPPLALLSLSDSRASHSVSETAIVSLRQNPHLLSNVAAEPLEVALQYCYFHTSSDGLEMNQAGRTAWDNEFVRVSPRQLCELASAAYYLDICDLVDLTCRAIAAIISGKTADQIRTTFHIENDLVQNLVFPGTVQGTASLSQPQKRRIDSRKVSPAPADDLADSDEQDSSQAANPTRIPQLGRNTVEEVENWINGDGNAKKTSKKRRKKKKNKTTPSLPDCSALQPTSLLPSKVDICSPTLSRGLPADESLSSSSINPHTLLTEKSSKEQPIPGNVHLIPSQTKTQRVQGCRTPTSTSSSSDEEVTLVCVATRKKVGRANARMSAGSLYANTTEQKDLYQNAEPSSPPSSPPPLPDVSKRIMEEEGKDDPKRLVWSTVSNEACLVHSVENKPQQSHRSSERSQNGGRGVDHFHGGLEGNSSRAACRTGPKTTKPGEDQSLQLTTPKSSCVRKQHQTTGAIVRNENHRLSAVPPNRSATCGLTTASKARTGQREDLGDGFYGGSDSSDKKRGGNNASDRSTDAMNSESAGVDPKEVQDLLPGVGQPSYIQCPIRMDREVADFEHRLRIGDDEAEPNGFCVSPQSDSMRTQRPDSLSIHQLSSNLEDSAGADYTMRENLAQAEYRVGESAREGFIQNRLRAVRREAQLVERERYLQQRADTLEKQITDLHAERENIRRELSLVVLELELYREETEL